MTERRKILTHLAAGLAALPAFALDAEGFGPEAEPGAGEDGRCVRPDGGPYADYFPNVVVHTHDGRKALFYRDLLRGRTVLVNCVSVRNDAVYPVTANLARVQRLLGERLGRDVFMYSLGVDPEHDTPPALRAFAERHGAEDGWLFLYARPEDVEVVRGSLFAAHGGAHARQHGGAHGSHAAPPVEDCSMGLIRYGNEAVGLWGSVPAKADPEWIAKRVSWVATRSAAAHPAGPTAFRRKGPPAVAPAKCRAPDAGSRS
jgi:protein SCO1/2